MSTITRDSNEDPAKNRQLEERRMESIIRYFLASFVLSALPFGGASAQSPTVNVEADYLMTLEFNCEPGHPMGRKLVVNCTGGSVHGPK